MSQQIQKGEYIIQLSLEHIFVHIINNQTLQNFKDVHNSCTICIFISSHIYNLIKDKLYNLWSYNLYSIFNTELDTIVVMEHFNQLIFMFKHYNKEKILDVIEICKFILYQDNKNIIEIIKKNIGLYEELEYMIEQFKKQIEHYESIFTRTQELFKKYESEHLEKINYYINNDNTVYEEQELKSLEILTEQFISDQNKYKFYKFMNYLIKL